jgi:hypothetical protein
MLPWLSAALASLLVVAATLWSCYEWQQRHEAARIVKAIDAEDPHELLLLLVEGTDFRLVPKWFGEPALILAVKSLPCGCDPDFAREAIGLLVSRGAGINEPGIEWKTALMHAASNGDLGLCRFLLSYGANACARDMFGRTAAEWAQQSGHRQIASLLRTAEA